MDEGLQKKKRTCSVCNNPGYVFSRDYMCFWALDNIKRFEIETKTGRAAHLYALKGVVKEPVLTQALASDNFSFSLSRIISAILWTSLCHDWAHSLPQSLRVQVSSLPEIQFPSALPSNNTTKLKLNLRGLAQKSVPQVHVQLVLVAEAQGYTGKTDVIIRTTTSYQAANSLLVRCIIVVHCCYSL